MASVVSEIIELLTSGIEGIATGIGQGLKSLVDEIFLTLDASTHAVTGLSTFGAIAVVFMGVSLAIGLCRFVVNWVTTLGK